jgi:SAM-dependent methyltransferase
MHRLPRSRPVDREKALLEASRDKRVIHIGFVDAPFLASKLAEERWLHGKLARVARSLVGIDLSEEGVRWAMNAGYEAYVADAQAPQSLEALDLDQAELVIAGEIIEHLDAPGPFLRAIRVLAKADGVLIVTTPNAYKHVNSVAALFGIELVHPDHTAWHSPRTLRTLIERNGWSVEEIGYYHNPLRQVSSNASLRRRLAARTGNLVRASLTAAGRLVPYYSDGLIAWCRQPLGPRQARGRTASA